MSTYRVAYGALERERAKEEKRHALLAERAPELRSLLARSRARLYAGAVGLVGAAATAVTLLARSESPAPAIALFSTVAASLSTYAALRLVPPSLPSEALREARAKREALSFGLPLVAASLLLPLTIHGLVYLPLGLAGSSFADALRSFSTWMVISAWVVGHAHATLAVLAALFARKLARTPTVELESRDVARRWVIAYWATVGASAVPGIVLIALPPLITMITGVLFIPAMFGAVVRSLGRERMAFEETEDALVRVDVGIEELEGAREELVEEALGSGARGHAS